MKYSYIVSYDEDKGDWEVFYDTSRDMESISGYDSVKDSVLLGALHACIPGIVPGL